ncbi:MAG: TetR/AcrR family transcriptional regulator [Gallionellaceae bacterium]|nr:TetR/AcrR family transcriptional regulator [Gallionellaceae bacterium]
MSHVLSPRPDTRFLVLDTALTLFTERGFFSTSVHDISREAGVSIGSIYHHFGDKEGVASALYEQLGARMEGLISEIRRRHTTAHDQAMELVSRLFQLTESEPRAMEFMLYAKHREFLPRQGPVCSSRPFVLMREIVSMGMERGEIRPMDTLIASASLFGGPLRMITGRLDCLVDKPLPECLDAVWACAWRAVAMAAPAP